MKFESPRGVLRPDPVHVAWIAGNNSTSTAVMKRMALLKNSTGRFTSISSTLGNAEGSQGMTSSMPVFAASTPRNEPSSRMGSSSAAA